MSGTIPSRRHELFNPKLFWPFIFATVAVAFSGSALYDFIKGCVGVAEFRWRYLVLFLVGLVVVRAWAELIERQIEQSIVRPRTRPAPQKKGLIALCSKEPVVRMAINHHLPELKHAWLIVSEETKSIADNLRKDFGDSVVEMRQIENEADCHEVAQMVREIIEQRPKDMFPQDIIVDFTGLTKPATAGAVLGALQLGAPLQYTGSIRIGDGLEPIRPEEIVLNYDVKPSFDLPPKAGLPQDSSQDSSQ
jgi:hypothetical protein